MSVFKLLMFFFGQNLKRESERREPERESERGERGEREERESREGERE